MNDFQPIIDWFTRYGDHPVLETNHGDVTLTWQHTQGVPVTTDIEVIVGKWEDPAPKDQWGGTILTTDNHPEWGKGRETEESLTVRHPARTDPMAGPAVAANRGRPQQRMGGVT